MTPDPGSPVRVVMTKWGERPHWEIPGVLLGSDEHGDWIAIPAGTPMARPGMSFVCGNDQASLVPAEGRYATRGWLATFHAAPWGAGRVATYVDITTDPTWDGATVRAADLDLDVVRLVSGEVYVDDEDEFAEHRVTLGYPPDLVAHAEDARDVVLDAVLNERTPFDGAAERWLARVAAVGLDHLQADAEQTDRTVPLDPLEQ